MGQRDEDLSIGHAGRGAVAERQGIGAVRQADVVEHQLDLALGDDFPDRAFHLTEVALGLLDASPGRHPHVQAKLSRIHCREEIPSDPG